MSAIPHEKPLGLMSVAALAQMADISIAKAWDVTNKLSPNFDYRAPRRIKIGRCTRFSTQACDTWIRKLIEEAE